MSLWQVVQKGTFSSSFPFAMDALAAAEASLQEQALAIKPFLVRQPIPGDGNCLYRAVAYQTAAGEAVHGELRRQSVHAAGRHWRRYACFMEGEDEAAVLAWGENMKANACWGDHMSCRTLSDFLGRPLVVWRQANLDQAPACFVPHALGHLGDVTPIYLLLDERRAGCEHYSALVPGAGAGAGLEPVEDGGRPAGSEGGKGWVRRRLPPSFGLAPNLGPWSRHGLDMDTMELLLADQDNGMTPKDIVAKYFPKNPEKLRPVRRWGKADKDRIRDEFQRHKRAAELDFRGQSRKQAASVVAVGRTKLDVLRRASTSAAGACDTAMGSWQAEAATLQARSSGLRTAEEVWGEEALQLFSVLDGIPGLPAASTATESSAETVAFLHRWMRVASWTFCPHCGRRSPTVSLSWNWAKNEAGAVCKPCVGGCDPTSEFLEGRQEDATSTKKLQAYITPQAAYWDAFRNFVCQNESSTWSDLFLLLPEKDMKALSLIELKVDFQTQRGGRAAVTSKQKKSLVRAAWKNHDVETQLPSEASCRAFQFLREHNSTYRHFLEMHRALLVRGQVEAAVDWRYPRTAELLLGMPGIEVAARPLLYISACFAETDLSERLKLAGVINPKSTPSLKDGWQRKILRRSLDYGRDFILKALLYDVSFAKTISAVVATAAHQGISPDEAVADMPQFEQYWHIETQKLEDVCRQMDGEKPNLFFTVAPAEWQFPLHRWFLDPLVKRFGLSECQAWLTQHFYHCMSAILEACIFKKNQL